MKTIDISKLSKEELASLLAQVSTKDLKDTLKAKRAADVAAEHAESRAIKIAKARMFAAYWEDLVAKAQAKLDKAIEARDAAFASLEAKEAKWLKSIPKDVMDKAMDEAIKAKNEADAKAKSGK